MKKLLIPLLAALILVGIISCSRLEEPKFQSIKGFKVKRLGFQQADIGFDVVYFNPNNFGVNVKEAAVDVYLDSLFIGKFTQAANVEVDKKADFAIPFVGSIPVAKALQLKLGDVVNKEVLVRAAGSVKVGKGGVFVSKDINYQGKHKVDLNQ